MAFGTMAAMIGGSLLGGAIAADGAKDAAKIGKKASDQDVALRREVYEDQTERFAPYLGSGTNALNAYSFELGLGERPEGYGGYTKTPGYDFRLNEGLNAVQSGVGARHGLNSGATLKALSRYGQDYATGEHTNHLRRLQGLSGMGQNAAGMQAAAGQQFANGAGNALTSGANAQAAGAVGQANAINSGIGNALGAWQFNQYMNQ